ncbi:MAG: hypothetical protein B9S38_02350 [Verrucomicrobiia bacterium Tous-C4TDCM]|nr:MAG: hypothetical protein B9S38_02350 [Verrucomicrobiae bacterium Tous-C4TDCM]
MNPSTATAASTPDRSMVEAIADLARMGIPRHNTLEQGDEPAIVWPDKTITRLEGLLDRPLRKRGTGTFETAESFIAYVLKHKETGTEIVGDANEQRGSFSALLDYHKPNTDGVIAASWTEHRATLNLTPTPEWTRWIGKNRTSLDQRAFAEFLEDNVADVIVPAAGAVTLNSANEVFPTQQQLLSIAATLQVKTDVAFDSRIKLQNGQQQLTYVEKMEGGHGENGTLPIPERFALAVAPFRGTPKYQVLCRLRYRAAGGKATFSYEIERPQKIVESAFNDIRSLISEKTGILPLVGSITPDTRPNR